jgi:hypothetical protein
LKQKFVGANIKLSPGAEKGRVLRKIELYFIKSGAVYSMVPHHSHKSVYTACLSGPADFAFQHEV